MPWYIYILQFIAGMLIANGVPHFTHGISGEPFPTPFARPPGVGASSPVINVLWGFANIAIGSALLHAIYPKGGDANIQWALVWLGGLLMALALAWHFGRARGGGRAA